MRVYVAGAVLDGVAVAAAPGAIAVRAGRVVAAGEAQTVLAAVSGDGHLEVINLPDRLLIPGLVNAHAHLDLTSLGHRPFDGSFINWVRMVMTQRPSEQAAIEAAVKRGAELSLASGVLTVGDIAGSPHATRAMQATGLRGVSYAELFGTASAATERVYDWPGQVDDAVRVGLQPHAPYSTRPEVYRMAGEMEVAWLATHLSETKAELEFVASGGGAWREMLRSIGKWSEELAACYGGGASPVEWMTKAATKGCWNVAHCNYVSDADIALLAERGWSVAYCPRASDYFGHSGHRYRDMLAAGVNVCLGTDSIICHGTLSMLDEMRHLYRRDQTDPRTLLRMATINGMHALQLPAIDASFAAGANMGIIALDYHGGPAEAAFEKTLSAEVSPSIHVIEPRRQQPTR